MSTHVCARELLQGDVAIPHNVVFMVVMSTYVRARELEYKCWASWLFTLWIPIKPIRNVTVAVTRDKENGEDKKLAAGEGGGH